VTLACNWASLLAARRDSVHTTRHQKRERGVDNSDELKQAISEYKPGAGDFAHATTKGLIQVIPGVGGLGAELFEFFIAPPLSKRRDKLLLMVAEGFVVLREQVTGFNMETLTENEAFISTVTHALQVGLRTHQEEKLEALRNATLNSALPNAPDDDIQLMFLNFIDTFTPWHLRLLQYFVNPREYGEKRGVSYPSWASGSPALVLEHTFPELATQQQFYRQMIRDLFSRGLISTGSIGAMSTVAGMFSSFATDFGKEFLAFITSPISADEGGDELPNT
jgi:hypothetical protein